MVMSFSVPRSVRRENGRQQGGQGDQSQEGIFFMNKSSS